MPAILNNRKAVSKIERPVASLSSPLEKDNSHTTPLANSQNAADELATSHIWLSDEKDQMLSPEPHKL